VGRHRWGEGLAVGQQVIDSARALAVPAVVLLSLQRREVAIVRVSTLPVVKHLDILEAFEVALVARRERVAELLFEAALNDPL
jgi:hypothetical protein